MKKKNLIVGQSGGPTAVINCSLYGVVKEALNPDNEIETVYGMVNGIEGFLAGNYLDFREALPGDKLELLGTTPGAYLGSCRYKLPEDLNDPVYPELFKKFEELNIGYFFYIGGNDSMDTVSKLSRYKEMVGSDLVVLGEPKTIDNDLVETDHTPGFGSAANYVATTVREIALDAGVYDKETVTIVEIMGRHAGWLTAAGALARKHEGDNPKLVYLPEVAFDENDFIAKIKNVLEESKNVVICVSEGIKNADGVFICEQEGAGELDSFGHAKLSGCGKYLADLVAAKLGIKTRAIELSTSQRCSSMLMSETDQQEAIMAGKFGVKAALAGETGKMIAFKRKDIDGDGQYEIVCELKDVNEICNKEKTIPVEWIINDGSDVSQEFFNYALPLIQGVVAVPIGEDGLPAFAYRK